MTKKGIVTKTAGVLVAMVLTVMFALPTFAAGYSPVSGSAGDTSFSGRVYINWNGAGAYLETSADADLSVSGKAKDEYGKTTRHLELQPRRQHMSDRIETECTHMQTQHLQLIRMTVGIIGCMLII